MKIQFLEAGYEKFTGYFGTVYFEDGVSTGDVSDAEARFFASITSIGVVGEGEIVGDNERYARSFELAAVSVTYSTLAEEEVQGGRVIGTVVKTAPTINSNTYTQAELEAIADKGGIGGLREISDKIDVKGTSIAKLIEGILNKQRGAQPEAAPLAEGQPDVVTSEQAE